MRPVCWTSALLMAVLSLGCGAGEDLLLGAKPSTEPPLKESGTQDPMQKESGTVSQSNGSAGTDQVLEESSAVKKAKATPFDFNGPLELWDPPEPMTRCLEFVDCGGFIMTSEADVAHLGHTVMDASCCISYITLGLMLGEAVFTAANGDTMNAIFWAEFEWVSMDDPAWEWLGIMTITGGSGRFQNATGTLVSIMSVWDYHSEKNSLLLNGTIFY